MRTIGGLPRYVKLHSKFMKDGMNDKLITLGIDIGSLTTKAVVLKDGKALAYHISLTGDSSYRAASRAVEDAAAISGIRVKDVDKFMSTGAGKDEIPYDGEQATEMLCNVTGARFFFPAAKTVIDMGAENSRAVRCAANGRVLDFT